MNQKTTQFYLIVLILALFLGACVPTPAADPQPAPSSEVPILKPTATLPPSQTPEPTEVVETQPPPTPEATAIPACTGIFKQDLFFYPIPSDSISGEWFTEGAYVDIIGQLNEPTWYQVNFINRIGWVLQGNVRLDDPNCKVPQQSLAEILDLQGTPILEDTFRDSNNWVLLYTPDQRPERLPDTLNNYTLKADGYFDRVALSAPVLENVTSFELATAFWRQNGGDTSSYVGIQYGNDEHYFEIRVLGSCEIEVMTSDGFYEKQTTRNDRNKCKDDISDYLFVRWSGNGTLEVNQNDNQQPYRFSIGTSMPASGRIQLIAEQARTQFDFIAVTEY